LFLAKSRPKIGAARMNIRFVSTLTAEDEANFAPALLRAVGSLLDQLPIAYTVRIETTGDQVFQHSHPAVDGQYGTDAFDPTTLGSHALAKP
jgi:hypothetical protein